MSLNDLKLPDFIIDELYKDCLLVPSSRSDTYQPAPPTAPAAPVPAGTIGQPPLAPAEPTTIAPPPPSNSTTLKFLGKNNRHFTILVHSPGCAFLPDDQLSFLTKILEACRMNIGDVAIVNAATAPVTIALLRQQLHPENILLFGLEPTDIRLPIHFPLFRPQPYDNCTYLSAPALSLLVQPTEESKLLKSKLWVCLKSLFNV